MKRLVVALLLALILAAVVQAQGPVIWLPLIQKGDNNMADPFQVLRIETIDDGKIMSINLLAPKSGFHLNPDGWNPSLAEPKSEVFRDSQLAEGRKLSLRRRQNITDTFDLAVRDWTPDDLIRDTQDLRRLLEKAYSYDTTDWQDEPVWIKRQGVYEQYPTYSIIHDYRTPQDGNPHGSDTFWTNVSQAAFANFTLVLEHDPYWTENQPGMGTCVETSGQQEDWHYEGEWLYNTNASAGQVQCIMQADNGYLFAGDDASTIIRSIDDGDTWAVNFAGLNSVCHCLLQTQNTYIYAGDWQAIWRTINYGGVWNVNFVLPVGVSCRAMLQTHTGAIIAGCIGRIYRSPDDGASWNQVLLTNHNFYSLVETPDGTLYAGSGHATNPAIWQSVDDGLTWTINTTLPAGPVESLAQQEGDIVAAILSATQQILASYDVGVTWQVTATNEDFGTDGVRDLMVGADGNLYVWGPANAAANTRLRVSDTHGRSWEIVTTLAGGVSGVGRGLAQAVYTDNRIYVGGVGLTADEIWRSGLTMDLGRSATCTDEVYVANETNVANLTHIKAFDTSAAPPNDYIDLGMPMAGFPVTLLQAAPITVGDMVYFGVDSTIEDSGPFCSLVFDIGTPASSTDSYTIVWEYYNGAWVTLNVTDNTDQGSGVFSQMSVNSVHWQPPADWIAVAIDGTTALWVRARVSALVGTLTAPTQQNRDIYTVNWAYTGIDDLQAIGDIPALMRFAFHNQSDKDGPAGSDPDAYANRVVAGLRSRGDQFVSFINLADEQNAPGVSVAVGANTVFANDIEAPSGRRMTHTTDGTSTWHDEAIVTLGPTVARDFYGSFHAYLRAQEVDRSAAMDEVRVRLQIRTGSGGITRTTDHTPFPNLNDWQLLDFGSVDIPASGLLSSTDLGDQAEIIVQIWSSVSSLTVNLYDLALMPADEWAADFIDQSLNGNSGIDNGYLLDVDSITYPKHDIRALVRTADAAGLKRSLYQSNTAGFAMLQSNANQRLYFLTARGAVIGTHTGANNQTTLTDSAASFLTSNVKAGQVIYNVTDGSVGVVGATITATTITDCGLAGGTDNDWDTNDVYLILCPNWRSEPWVTHSLQVWRNARYLSMRGAR